MWREIKADRTHRVDVSDGTGGAYDFGTRDATGTLLGRMAALGFPAINLREAHSCVIDQG